MTDFRGLDRADNWLARVVSAVNRGHAARTAPGAGAREARLLVAAVKRRDRASGALVGAGVPEGVVRTRLADRAEDRARGPLARHRSPRQSARASR